MMKKIISKITPKVKLFFGPLILVALAQAMLYLSWQKWPDVLVDFGRELYLPWQLNQGKLLYQDITHLYGPFSHYFNSWLFAIFGTQLLTLAIFNIGLIAVLTYLIYRIFYQSFGPLTATATSATFLSIFSFSQYVGIANYNFVCPYSHEVTHGIVVAFFAIYALMKYLKQRKNIWLALMGISVGLVWLTKVEVFLAISLAVLSGLFLLVSIEKLAVAKTFKMVGIFCSGFLVPSIGFFAYFTLHLPLKQAWAAITTPYQAIFGTAIPSNIFYQTIFGIDKPMFNLIRLCIVTGWYILVLLIFILLSYCLSRIPGKKVKKVITLSILGAVIILALVVGNRVAWMEMARPFPLFMLALGGYLFIQLKTCRDDGQKVIRLLPIFVLTVFAFMLLLKMVLNTHVFHYGFALAMPASLLLVMVFVEQLPVALGRLFGTTLLIRALGLILLGAVLVFHISFTKQLYDVKTYAVGSGGDTIRAMDPRISLRGIVLNLTLQKIKEEMGEDDTFVVFPEGVMLNYLSRRKNPTPYFEFTPPMVQMLGEERIINAMQKNLPDYVILTHKDTSEHGYRYFGQDYGQDIFNWISQNYTWTFQIGNHPLSDQGFGVIIAKCIGKKGAE